MNNIIHIYLTKGNLTFVITSGKRVNPVKYTANIVFELTVMNRLSVIKYDMKQQHWN